MVLKKNQTDNHSCHDQAIPTPDVLKLGEKDLKLSDGNVNEIVVFISC